MTTTTSPEGPATPRRTITGRASLPNGRAVVGAVLITLAAVGAFTMAGRGDTGPTTSYLVVTADIAAGQPVRLADVAPAPMELDPSVSRHALVDTTGLDGATALRALRPGEILDVRDLDAAPYVDGEPLVGIHELTFPVPLDRAPATLRRGDRITLLHADDTGLTVALEDAVVLDYRTDESSLVDRGTGVLTLALPDAASVGAGAFYSHGDVTVVLTSRAIADAYPGRFDFTADTAADSEGEGVDLSADVRVAAAATPDPESAP